LNRASIEHLLGEAAKLTNHREYVIIGSLSVLGQVASPPESMVYSIDIDLYAKSDPGRSDEIARNLGLGSAFEQANGYYADPVSPALATLPEGWESRLVRLPFANGTTGWFLEPNDAAISKYVRAELRDREWIWAGLQSGILSPAVIEYRMRETVMETDERARSQAAFAEDRARLAGASGKPRE
jgi:hypothetical protein